MLPSLPSVKIAYAAATLLAYHPLQPITRLGSRPIEEALPALQTQPSIIVLVNQCTANSANIATL